MGDRETRKGTHRGTGQGPSPKAYAVGQGLAAHKVVSSNIIVVTSMP